ncbi:hydrogenase maturation nickel metallochaperone HypA [Deinococcus koreensis]|uniref:Hydrogenase maturation factor HypA n=1 Tax=Deinococcus koreensis TaxID=2054903 RepID=A0A2K3UTH0_9DEIO|nr:hydrogenase maturation nickel metallochaperone HypA [Deinococcus koreensis]PNY79843.1 hypothetical protein CVO96_18055 [Deinococcus koreensis]
MHEASIALALIDVANDVLREHGAARAQGLTVRIGQWSSVVPEALQAAFPACALGTGLEGARLSIVTVPGVGECRAHGAVELELTRGLRCPLCGLPTPMLLQGDELELDEVELVPGLTGSELIRAAPELPAPELPAPGLTDEEFAEVEKLIERDRSPQPDRDIDFD